MKLRTWFLILVFPIVVAAIFAAAVAAAINWPTLVVNPTTLRIAVRHLATLSIVVDWKHVRVASHSHGTFDETLSFAFDDLCISRHPSLKKACFAKADIAVRYRFRSLRPEIVALGPIDLEGGDVILQRPEKLPKERSAKVPSLPRLTLPAWLRAIALFPASLSIDAFELTGDGASLKGAVAVQAIPDDDHALQSIEAQGRIEDAQHRAAFTAGITSASRFTRGDWQLNAKAEAALGAPGNIALTADLASDDGTTIRHAIALTTGRQGMTGTARLEGTLSDSRLDTSLSGTLKGLSQAVPDISFSGCRLSLARKEAEQNRGALALDCPLAVGLKKFQLPGEVRPLYEAPTSLRVRLTGSADTFFLPDLREQTTGNLTARLEPTRDRLVKTAGEVRLAFAGVPSQPLRGWNFSATSDIHFLIDRFSHVVQRLSATRWPVPAPFNVLDGTLDFSFQGTLSSSTGLARIPAKLTARLRSQEQRIDAESQGELTFTVGPEGLRDGALDLSIDLTDVQLQLPDVSLASIPRLRPDKRIHAGPAPSAAPSEGKPFAWRIHIATPPKQPGRVLSNVTPTFIPVAVDLDLERGKTTGTVSITDFPVEIFRQKGKVDRFAVELKQPSRESTVSGAFSIPYAPYTITILLAGTFESPIVTFTSTPPLSHGDIISMLLYGEPLNALDSTSSSSVSSMNAALSDRALALTTLLLLAATPIQNIAYNPQTKTFTARIKLADKTSLIAGGGNERQEVGIRQNLGKGWSVTTSYTATTDPSTLGGATALIEWTKRY
jgi:TamB, inner membrane protein subunit of TAM complex